MNLNAVALEDPRTPGEALSTCFLCGHRVIQTTALWFGTAPEKFDGILVSGLAPELPCHRDCVNGRTPLGVATSFHRAVADIFDVRRAGLPHHIANA